MTTTCKPIAFRRIGDEALRHSQVIVPRWLPDGRRFGREWVARNPLRADRKAGSFRVNLATGRWSDFALDDAKGRDLIGLARYLFQLRSQSEAALRIAEMLGIDPHD